MQQWRFKSWATKTYMAMFPFSSVISLGIAFRRPLEEEEEELRRPDLSLPLPLDMAGSDFTVISEALLSLLALVAALNREEGPLLIIVTLPCLLYIKRQYGHVLVSAYYRDVIGNV